MIHTNELTKLDYQILEFVNNRGTVPEDEIKNKFSSNIEATKLRIDSLATPDQMNKLPYCVIPNTAYLKRSYVNTGTSPTGARSYKYTGDIKLTALGEKALQDYLYIAKTEKHEKIALWAWRIIPVIISFLALLKSYGWV